MLTVLKAVFAHVFDNAGQKFDRDHSRSAVVRRGRGKAFVMLNRFLVRPAVAAAGWRVARQCQKRHDGACRMCGFT
jgi:hypothetical protein